MFKRTILNAAKNRLFDEQLYEKVALEIQQGDKRTGVWAKALSQSNGNEKIAISKYIELRVQSIKDEMLVTQEVLNQEAEFQKQRDNTWYIVCDKNDPETVDLIVRAKKKIANHQELKLLCSKMGIEANGKVGLFKDSWVIKDQNGKTRQYNDSDDLESFLVNQYEMLK